MPALQKPTTNQKTRNQETKKLKKQETNKLKNQETKQRKNQKNKKTKQPKKQDCTPQGEGSSGRELGLVIFSNVFLWFLVFFWILVLFSHCTKNQQRTRKQETKKPKKQKKQETKKQKNKKKIGKKTRLHTPRGGVVAESWVLSFFQTFFCGFLFFFGSWFCLAIAQKINNEPENKKPRNQKNKKNKKPKNKKNKKNRKKNKIAHPKGRSSGRELDLVIFSNVFLWFLVFFGSWFCLAIAQKINNEPENKKPRNQKNKKQQETKKQKKQNKSEKNKIAHPKGGVVAESWVLSFFQTFFCGFLFFFGSWFCLAIAQKINNEPENKKPRNQKNKKNKKPKNKKKQNKSEKNKIAHPKGRSSGRELGLVIFSNVFLWFLVFFWILVLFSHCTKNQQRTRKQETKKPKKQKKQETKKQKKQKNIGKKTRLHTPRWGVVAESWVLSFFQTFFCGFLFFFDLGFV